MLRFEVEGIEKVAWGGVVMCKEVEEGFFEVFLDTVAVGEMDGSGRAFDVVGRVGRRK